MSLIHAFSYAITRLKQAPDEDLVLYLLQLVQALKYENFDDIEVLSIENCIFFLSIDFDCPNEWN